MPPNPERARCRDCAGSGSPCTDFLSACRALALTPRPDPLSARIAVPRCEDVTMQPGIWPACQAEPSFLAGTVIRAQGTAWLCDLCGTRRPLGTKQCSYGFRPDLQRGDESRPEFPSCRWSSLPYQVVSPPVGHFLGRAPAGMCREEGTSVGMTSPLAFLPSLW